MGAFEFLEKEIDRLRQVYLYRQPRLIESPQGTTVTIDGQSKVIFCSNNYLALACDGRVVAAVAAAVAEYGQGAGASRLVSGTMRVHKELEEELAAFFGKEAALVFPSGWMANDAVLKTLAGKGDLLLLDKLDHASIIDAARASEAEFRTYRRGRYERLEKLLADGDYRRKFIVTESIFSMDGDAADLRELVELKNRYGAYLILDEAHAVGCFGKRGAGLAEELGLLDEVDIVVATLSKALGSAGGVVAGPRVVIDWLVNKARSFIYTTAASVANCAAARAALEIVKAEPQRREKLRKNAEYLREKLKRLGLDTGRSCSQIIPVIVGDEKRAVELSARLYEKGYFVVAIRPPTVPPGTARLRVSVQSEHTAEQIDGLCTALAVGLRPTEQLSRRTEER